MKSLTDTGAIPLVFSKKIFSLPFSNPLPVRTIPFRIEQNHPQGKAYVTVFGVEKNDFTELTEEVETLRSRVVELEGERDKTNPRIIEFYERNMELSERFDRLDKFVKKWLKDRMSEDEIEEMESSSTR